MQKLVWALICGLGLVGACNPATPTTNLTEKSSSTTHVLPPVGQATSFTQDINTALATRLNLGNEDDLERAKRGLLAQIPGGIIYNVAGEIVWSNDQFSFLEEPIPATANPSLWQQARRNAVHGLFEVTQGVYQLRGYDLATMTLIEGKTGWIVIDPLLTAETSSAALGLARQHLGKRAVSAVIYTHSHADHFGGVRGVLSEQQIETGSIPIIAPKGFAEEAISENVLAGPAMARRAAYMFGAILPAGPAQMIDSGIGKTLSRGQIGFVAPTKVIIGHEETLQIDGITFEFLNTPGAEAPSEFVFYLPSYKTLFTSEIALSSLHNVLTLRGAKVRDALAWSKYLDLMIQKWGQQAEFGAASHNWPTWGNSEINEWLANQRDIYRYIHDQTLRLANNGATIHEIGNLIEEPAFQSEDFAVRGYYGTLNHNSKATYQRYFGYFDGNPAHLNTLPPEQEAVRMVELAGGADKLLTAGQAAFERGEYRWAASLLNHLVFAEPKNQAAKNWLAAAYEQMGFQAESAPWRNIYLTGALELRDGIQNTGPQTSSADIVEAIPLQTWFEALATRLNPQKAGDLSVDINFTMTDTNETVWVHVQNGVTSIRAELAENPTLDVHMNRADLNAISLGTTGFGRLLATGRIKVDGNPLTLIKYLKAHDQPDPFFAIVTP